MTALQRAVALVKAVDAVRVLQQCERQTGERFVRSTDEARVRDAAVVFAGGTPIARGGYRG